MLRSLIIHPSQRVILVKGNFQMYINDIANETENYFIFSIIVIKLKASLKLVHM
jgi:hypothetical protein